ncbi:D-alanyl-D-alanine carboxypeptidase [Desulfoluna sp.]|uniref:D-alanyl-D-alanine carboxypeptidase/D-alanyl-D-alanine-endopeptidase n=1 Tax=Desulfoluna sp. TaxID=2045199 RepID=UPI00260880C6|nr:D-alanyl-D-alanine carboxypeptidase [Desulfoluna sp.]
MKCHPGLILGLLFLLVPGPAGGETLPARLAESLHPSDALLVIEEPHRVVFSQNAEVPCVPASTLKIATALFAFATLGETYRFPTDVSVSPDRILYLKGYGDPLLISEVLDRYAHVVAGELRAAGIHAIKGMGVDGSYFAPITIPGVVMNSEQPYDAPNGALCANFNTVFYTRNAQGVPVSAEPQTPLLPFIEGRMSASTPSGRVRLTPTESRLYAGHLFRWFLQKHGIQVTGSVQSLPYPAENRLYEKRLLSPSDLTETIKKLMTFSNNFLANQLYLASAARTEGAPATLEKGRKAFCRVMTRLLKTCPDVVEGSGISRQNKVTARLMCDLLMHFAPYAHLLHVEGDARFKTGTLTDVSTRAGYLTTAADKRYRFVIFTHRHGANAGTVLNALKTELNAR